MELEYSDTMNYKNKIKVLCFVRHLLMTPSSLKIISKKRKPDCKVRGLYNQAFSVYNGSNQIRMVI